jgi:hypothetical protein
MHFYASIQLPANAVLWLGPFFLLILPVIDFFDKKHLVWWKRLSASSWVMGLLGLYLLVIIILKFTGAFRF